MIDMKKIPAYELEMREELPDVQSWGWLLRHRKSGARVMLLENQDDNKVFCIGFRTTPANSTGVAHIMEHSVLCGSRNFPVKDPFVELVKGSMNTFLNAMTYPDKTLYPVASCNDMDFANLMHVYLDAVFYPAIYQHPEIFRQEGWSWQMEDKQSDLVVNGVVYNEMKGAFSSPDDVLEREIMNSLFPDNTYHYESGGDPDVIPELTYEEFLDFHRKYYHPSNSYIYLYGNMDFEERLNWMDREYLNSFSEDSVDSSIALQKPFREMITVKKKYSITAEDSEEDNTYLAFSTAVGTSLDTRLANSFAVLEYVLLEAPGAPLKQALLDAGIGSDIQGSYDSGTLQPVFSVIAKGANEGDRDRFLQVIRDTLEDINKQGLNEDALQAAVNMMEFRFREADYGTLPKGLMYGTDAFDSWLYDDHAPFSYLKVLDDFAFLKKQAGTGYYEGLIRTWILDNPHAALVLEIPEKGLAAKAEAQLAQKLQQKKAAMTEKEITKLVEDTAALRKYQETASTQEELETIPLLTREDLRKEALPLKNEILSWNGADMVYHSYATNGIAYIQLLFDASMLTPEDLPFLGILKNVLEYVNTEHYSYAQLSNEINRRCGGITPGISVYPDVKDHTKAGLALGIMIRTLYDEIPFCFDMVKEILLTSDLRQEKRLHEIINQLKSRVGTSLQEAGSATAVTRCMSYFSALASVNDRITGITYYQTVKDIAEHFDDRKEELMARLERILKKILTGGHLMVSYTGDRNQLEMIRPFCENLVCLWGEDLAGVPEKQKACTSEDGFPGITKEEIRKHMQPIQGLVFDKKCEGFRTPGKVQYVAQGGNFKEAGFDYHGSMKVLRTIMSYDYLWNQLRVVGGAYGCSGSFSRSGDASFVSFRDPHLKRTLEVYAGIPSYLRQFDAGERDMTKYVIGTVSDMDTPLTPSIMGSRSMNALLCGITQEMLQKERDQVLAASVEDIRALAEPVSAVLEQNGICALGGEDKINEQKDLFGSCVSL